MYNNNLCVTYLKLQEIKELRMGQDSTLWLSALEFRMLALDLNCIRISVIFVTRILTA
jgi:hypothetical protein